MSPFPHAGPPAAFRWFVDVVRPRLPPVLVNVERTVPVVVDQIPHVLAVPVANAAAAVVPLELMQRQPSLRLRSRPHAPKRRLFQRSWPSSVLYLPNQFDVPVALHDTALLLRPPSLWVQRTHIDCRISAVCHPSSIRGNHQSTPDLGFLDCILCGCIRCDPRDLLSRATMARTRREAASRTERWTARRVRDRRSK